MKKLGYLLLAAIPLPACQSTPDVESAQRRAFLGIETRVPPEHLAREMGLDFEVRPQGRLVTTVTGGSAACQAGIRDGDLLLRLDDVTLYSQDDIDDFVSVRDPGDQVTATVIRSRSHEQGKLRVRLREGRARNKDGIQWQYASLAQVPAALERARADKKKVLVGLSGAET